MDHSEHARGLVDVDLVGDVVVDLDGDGDVAVDATIDAQTISSATSTTSIAVLEERRD